MMRLVSLMIVSSALMAIEVGDHVLPDRVKIGDTDIVIRGGGTMRWYRMVSIYDVGLWVDAARTSASPLDDIAKRLEFHYCRSFSASDLAEATTATLGKNASMAERENLRPRLLRLNALYSDVVKNDVLTFTYVPASGTAVEFNGRLLDTIPGADFAHALFAIWLGTDPVDVSFRDVLLGKP